MNTRNSVKPADLLAVSVAIASLEMLKRAAADLGCPIEVLTQDQLMAWVLKQPKVA